QAVSSGYWAKQLRSTVQFSKAVLEARDIFNPVFLEIGPGGVCTQHLRQHGPNFSSRAMASLPYGAARSEAKQWLHTAGRLWGLGYALNWAELYSGEQARIIPSLPAYAYHKQSYWLAP